MNVLSPCPNRFSKLTMPTFIPKPLNSLSLVFLTSLFLFSFFPYTAEAACTEPSPGGNYTVSSSCVFSGTNNVHGVDNGGITINNGATLTIGPNQTIVWGPGQSIVVNGSIAITNTGQLKQTNLWMIDADSDGYPESTTQVAQDNAPTNGRRRNVMTTYSSADVNDGSASVWQSLNCYTDADGDGYDATGSATATDSGADCPAGKSQTTSGTDCDDTTNLKWRNRYLDGDGDTYGAGSLICVGDDAGYVDSSNDCYDSNANAKPGQTSYFSTERGDGSWDYDCDDLTTRNPSYNCIATTESGCFNWPGKTAGYRTTIPSCGDSATYSNMRCYGETQCDGTARTTTSCLAQCDAVWGSPETQTRTSVARTMTCH